MMVSTSIDRWQWNRWYPLFKLYNGRFLSNPVVCSSRVYVFYTFENDNDYEAMNSSWNRLTSVFVEVPYRPKVIKKLLNRLLFVFKRYTKVIK